VIYISDKELWDVLEKWLTIEELKETRFALNIEGMKSDCEEHANYLCSLLIASGVSRENVRVVLGEVQFGDSKGGHAWVEIFKNGQWIPLESSCGDMIQEGKLYHSSPLPLWYFSANPYPESERWVEYNDVYYKNFISGEQTDLPANWSVVGEYVYPTEEINKNYLLLGGFAILLLAIYIWKR